MAEFLIESQENLDRIEQELIELEKDPSQLDRITTIFRAIHTIKGTCGFLELRKLESVTHAGENLLVTLRDGVLPLTPSVASILLELVDAVREMLIAVKATSQDGTDEYPLLVQSLNRCCKQRPAPDSRPRRRRNTKARSGTHTASIPSQSPIAEPPPVASTPTEATTQHVALPVQAADGSAAASAVRGPMTIRVDVSVLEDIMTLVGELVLARNQLLELTQDQVRTPLAATCQRLNQITTDLQGSVMKTRMQPIGTVWNKLPRVVRELAVQCEKRVQVALEGSETELDKTVIEAISEPLTHIIRNAVDHGIESPERRMAAGKPVEGRIRLSAGHKGGHVVIEISDDGAGIDIERVKQKAIEKGMVSQAQAKQMTQADAYALLFAPGLSTAQKVTNISGRGVGMDVVRTNIERIGGSIDTFSELGRGTRFRVRLPLTLAIVPAIIVSSSGQRFAIPQQGLQELLRIGPNSESIEYVQGAPVLRLRGRLLPLAWLSDLLTLPRSDIQRQSHHIIVLQSGEMTLGLVVDEVTNSEEIVVKPLSPLVSGVNVYAGCTILGDGQVALILEATNLISRARRDVAQQHPAAHNFGPTDLVEQRRGFVLCDVGMTRVAIPLEQIERLEKVRSESIECRSGRAVLQYRGHVISVVRFESRSDQFYEFQDLADEQGRLHTLIYRAGRNRLAVVVNRILDVVEQAIMADNDNTLIALGRVTELGNLASLIPAQSWAVNDDAHAIAEVA